MINDLIFLGQVPGTNFQITFSEFLALADIALCLYLLRNRLGLVARYRFHVRTLRLIILTRRGQQLRLPV